MVLNPELKSWIRDIGEVVLTLAVIIIISQLLFGAKMLIPLVAVTSTSMLHTTGTLDTWDGWLIRQNVSSEDIQNFPMQGGFNMGDMILTITPDGKGVIHPFFSETRLGDVVIYERDLRHMPGQPPIIHRVVGVIEVEDWEVASVEGALDCLTEEDFESKYIPLVENCVSGDSCAYPQHPESGDFRFYITKGDNMKTNSRSDQCAEIAYPVTDEQLTARGWIVIPYVGWVKLILNALIPL